MLQIGVISDTHGFFHPAISTAFDGVDAILHAGDVGRADILVELNTLAPTHAVYGNVDGFDVRGVASETVRIEFEQVDFWMTHIGGRPGRWERGIKQGLKELEPDVFVCGHSHILRVERVTSPTSFLYVNPGAAGRQGLHQVKTCLRLGVQEGRVKKVDVIHLDEI